MKNLLIFFWFFTQLRTNTYISGYVYYFILLTAKQIKRKSKLWLLYNWHTKYFRQKSIIIILFNNFKKITCGVFPLKIKLFILVRVSLDSTALDILSGGVWFSVCSSCNKLSPLNLIFLFRVSYKKGPMGPITKPSLTVRRKLVEIFMVYFFNRFINKYKETKMANSKWLSRKLKKNSASYLCYKSI